MTDFNVFPKPVPYKDSDMTEVLQKMQQTLTTAHFGLDFLDMLTTFDFTMPASPWTTPVPLTTTMSLKPYQPTLVHDVTPVMVAVATYQFLPLIAVTQDEGPESTLLNRQWMYERYNTLDSTTVRVPFKVVWGGMLSVKPTPVFKEESEDDTGEWIRTTWSVSFSDGYQVLIYYKEACLYFVLLPIQTPGINTVAFYTSSSNLDLWFDSEYSQRILADASGTTV